MNDALLFMLMLQFHLKNKEKGAICNHSIGKPELFSVLEGKIYSLLLFNTLLTPWMKVLCLPAFTQLFQIISFRVAAHKVMKGVRGKKATINSREFVAVCFFLVVFKTKLFTCPHSASAPLKRLINGSISVNRSHKCGALLQFRFTHRAVKHDSLLSLWNIYALMLQMSEKYRGNPQWWQQDLPQFKTKSATSFIHLCEHQGLVNWRCCAIPVWWGPSG